MAHQSIQIVLNSWSEFTTVGLHKVPPRTRSSKESHRSIFKFHRQSTALVKDALHCLEKYFKHYIREIKGIFLIYFAYLIQNHL